MIPGVSRSGATIVGALMLGVAKRAAAEFSFFLSACRPWARRLPMTCSRTAMCWISARSGEIAVGFAVAFVTAVLVVRWLLSYVSRNGYALFGWWRIIVGTAGAGGAFGGVLGGIGNAY